MNLALQLNEIPPMAGETVASSCRNYEAQLLGRIHDRGCQDQITEGHP